MNTMADQSKSMDDRIKSAQVLVNSMQSDTKQYGYNYDNLINQYGSWRTTNHTPTTSSWSGNTSKTPTTSYDKYTYTWK